MSPAPKKGLADLIGAPKGGDEEEPGPKEGDLDDARDAMQAFIEAVAAKDVDGALEAFGALHDFHAAAEDAGPAAE